jgi:hypothetical protein
MAAIWNFTGVLTPQIFFPGKALNRFGPNLAEMFIGTGRSSTRFVILVQFSISAKNKNLVYDHPMNISAKFGSNLFCGFRKKDENMKFP